MSTWAAIAAKKGTPHPSAARGPVPQASAGGQPEASSESGRRQQRDAPSSKARPAGNKPRGQAAAPKPSREPRAKDGEAVPARSRAARPASSGGPTHSKPKANPAAAEASPPDDTQKSKAKATKPFSWKTQTTTTVSLVDVISQEQAAAEAAAASGDTGGADGSQDSTSGRQRSSQQGSQSKGNADDRGNQHGGNSPRRNSGNHRGQYRSAGGESGSSKPGRREHGRRGPGDNHGGGHQNQRHHYNGGNGRGQNRKKSKGRNRGDRGHSTGGRHNQRGNHNNHHNGRHQHNRRGQGFHDGGHPYPHPHGHPGMGPRGFPDPRFAYGPPMQYPGFYPSPVFQPHMYGMYGPGPGPAGPYMYGPHPGQGPAPFIPPIHAGVPPHMPPHPGFLPPHLGRQHDILAYMAEAGPDSNIFAIDVECVATGIRSSDRMPARVVILNFEEEVVLDAFIKPELPVVSCLTQLTGVTMENLEAARPLQVVQQQICEVLGPDAYVVGQSVQHDIEWMGLRKGQDYRDTLDVSHLFRVRKPRADGTYKFSYFSLKHTCKYLLHMDIQSGIHNPAEDALGALRIFKKFRSTSRDHVQVCQETLLRSPRTKSFSQIHKLIDGVALSREFDNLALSRQKQRQEHKQRQEQQQAAAAPDDAAEAAQASAEGTPASEAEKAAEATP